MPNTLPELREQYLENADYDLENSVAKAKLFIAACRKLVLLTPKQGQTGGAGGEMFEFDTARIPEEVRRAERWLAGRGTNRKYFDISDYRQ